MEAYEHAIISTVGGLLAVPMIFQDLNIFSFTVLWILSIAAGTLIDLDHFLIAAIRDKNFSELRLALSNPVEVLSDNNSALDDLIPNWSRYVSHFILLFAMPAGIYLVNYKLSLLVFTMLALHISCDLYRSFREGQKFFD